MINRFKVGVGTIERTLRLFDSSELTLDELKAMEPKDVEELFYPHEQIRRKNLSLPVLASADKDLIGLFQLTLTVLATNHSRNAIVGSELNQMVKNVDGIF